MNFTMIDKAASILDHRHRGKRFIEYLAKKTFKKNREAFGIDVIHVAFNDYLGNNSKARSRSRDLLFTRTFLKKMKKYVSAPLARLLLNMSDEDFSRGKRLRKQGKLYSVLVPGTNQQKVLQFCSLQTEKSNRRAYILADIDDAREWNYHGRSLASENAFDKKATDRQHYYMPIYNAALQKL